MTDIRTMAAAILHKRKRDLQLRKAKCISEIQKKQREQEKIEDDLQRIYREYARRGEV